MAAGADGEQLRVPVLAERLTADARPVELGELRVHTRVDEVEETVRRAVERDELDVERVPVNRPLEAPVAQRTEGEWLVIPVMEEVLVVRTQLMLKEELRVRTRRVTAEQEVRQTVRRGRVELEDATRDGVRGLPEPVPAPTAAPDPDPPAGASPPAGPAPPHTRDDRNPGAAPARRPPREDPTMTTTNDTSGRPAPVGVVGVHQAPRTTDAEIPEAYNLGRDRVRFGPVVAGLLTALTTLLLLGLLGVAIGLTAVERRRRRGPRRRGGGHRPLLRPLGRPDRAARLRARRLRRRAHGGRVRPPLGGAQRGPGVHAGGAPDAVAGRAGAGLRHRRAGRLRRGPERRPGPGAGRRPGRRRSGPGRGAAGPAGRRGAGRGGGAERRLGHPAGRRRWPWARAGWAAGWAPGASWRWRPRRPPRRSTTRRATA